MRTSPGIVARTKASIDRRPGQASAATHRVPRTARREAPSRDPESSNNSRSGLMLSSAAGIWTLREFTPGYRIFARARRSLVRDTRRHSSGFRLSLRSPEDGLHRYTYRDLETRSKRLGKALERLGVRIGDRIATLAWNGYRHLELYYGVSGIGAVCHTINPRLFQDQIRYIVNHAADRVLFLDPGFVPLIEELAPHVPKVEHYVVMTEAAKMPRTKLPNVLCYEDLIAAERADYEWPEFDENTASSLCYTSGTTGRPKGVLYSHRSTVLHAMAESMRDTLDYSMHDVICLIAPRS